MRLFPTRNEKSELAKMMRTEGDVQKVRYNLHKQGDKIAIGSVIIDNPLSSFPFALSSNTSPLKPSRSQSTRDALTHTKPSSNPPSSYKRPTGTRRRSSFHGLTIDIPPISLRPESFNLFADAISPVCTPIEPTPRVGRLGSVDVKTPTVTPGSVVEHGMRAVQAEVVNDAREERERTPSPLRGSKDPVTFDAEGAFFMNKPTSKPDLHADGDHDLENYLGVEIPCVSFESLHVAALTASV